VTSSRPHEVNETGMPHENVYMTYEQIIDHHGVLKDIGDQNMAGSGNVTKQKSTCA